MIMHLHRVRESRVGAWLSLGWVAYDRERIPSVSEWIVCIEWKGEGDPSAPEPETDA